jgi:hypothetical protein
MIKNRKIFNIPESEKSRILEMHFNATKNQYLKNNIIETEEVVTKDEDGEVEMDLSTSPKGVILPNIDYNYWLSKSGGNTTKREVSTKTIRTLLTNMGYIKPDGLLYDLVYDPENRAKSIKGIWDSAKEIAKDLNINDSNNDEKLIALFDAIQLWGGKGGRTIYNKKNNKNLFFRDDIETWLPLYRQGVDYAMNNKLEDALKVWLKIPQLDIPFASKHLGFWASSPIYDTRMSRMIFGKLPRPNHYNEYVSVLKQISDKVGIENIFDIEQALFTFSDNYFDNKLTKIVLNSSDKTDENEALRILKIRTNK